jgi:hypothetical protein
MSALSDYLEVELIKHVFRTGSFTKPTVLAVALFTATPSDAGGGTEVAGGLGYARVDRPPLDANWDAVGGAGTDGHTSNTAAITFGAPTSNWGQVTHFAIFDNTTGGNLLFWGALTTPKTVNNGDPAPVFAIGALDVTLA